MVKFRFKEYLAKRELETGEAISIIELSKLLNISKNTLYRIANSKGNYNTTTDNLEKLCRFFNCTLDDFVIFVSDPPEPTPQESKPE